MKNSLPLRRCWLVHLLCLSSPLFAMQAAPQRNAAAPAQPSTFSLSGAWYLQSSGKVDQDGATLSKPNFESKNWYEVSVPTTVVAAMVKHKVYPDPYFGMNLRSYPGMNYAVGTPFTSVPMAQDSPFLVPWWYRCQFTIPPGYAGKTIWLRFNGINYGANIWLNGKRIATLEEVAGTWRTYEFDVTATAEPGHPNALAVEVFSPTEKELALTFWDWNASPPDKQMGIFRNVEIVATGPVALRFPTVTSKVDSSADGAAQAHLTVLAQLKNAENQPVKGTLRGNFEDVQFFQDVKLGPRESKDVAFRPEQFAQLNLHHPKLWWPSQMGDPALHDLHMEFVIGSRISDRSDTEFGIREINSKVNANKGRVFSINGKNILIRGGGWAMDMLLRENPQRLLDEFAYVKDMGLNTIRLEGMLETPDFFDLADRQGILVMAGWVCCSHWEHWPNWKPQDFDIAQQSLRDQMYRLRSHPSMVMWLNGSDNPPPPDVEQMYLKVESDLGWPNPTVSSATGKATSVSGDSGVKMTGPYDYVAPGYWQQDSLDSQTNHKECNPGGCGGAYGFNTETSPGPAVPPIESIRRMIPEDHLWPIDDVWSFHAGGGVFKDVHIFTGAVNSRYGAATGVYDYAAKSQLLAYESIRAMFEAYSRNKYASTGVIQWMLNNAWPSMSWHLYDYYLRPGGGYFGAKTAMQPLHPIYGYDDHAIYVVSSQYRDASQLKLTTRVLNLDMTEKYSHQDTLDAPSDSTQKILALPEIPDLSGTYFLVLRLEDNKGNLVGSNFYWLSRKPETLDWANSNWYTTPTASYADFTALSQLPKVKLKVEDRTERQGQEAITHVSVENPSNRLAFAVRLKIDAGRGGEEILPVIWQDNYFSLLPGEKRELTATYRASELGGAKPSLEVSGWNIQ